MAVHRSEWNITESDEAEISAFREFVKKYDVNDGSAEVVKMNEIKVGGLDPKISNSQIASQYTLSPLSVNRLLEGQELTYETVNFMMNVLRMKSVQCGKSDSVFVANTVVTTDQRFNEDAFRTVINWMAERGANGLYAHTIIPILSDGHYVLAHFEDRTFTLRCTFLNSVKDYGSFDLNFLKQHFPMETMELYQQIEVRVAEDVQQQKNSLDCGVFAIANASAIVHGEPLPQSGDPNVFRKKIALVASRYRAAAFMQEIRQLDTVRNMLSSLPKSELLAAEEMRELQRVISEIHYITDNSGN